jgi:DNA-binding protein YbaB
MTGPDGLVLQLSELESLPPEQRLEACRQFIERATEAIGAAHGRSVTASDPAGLVTVTVSGTGSVDEVRLDQAAMLVGRDELEQSVRAAVDAARTELSAQVGAAVSAIRVEGDAGVAPAPGGPDATLLAQVRDGLAGSRYEKSSPNGEVLVVVDRDGELSHIRLSTTALRQMDRHTLGELITASIQDAQRQAADALSDAVGEAWRQTSNSPRQGLGSNTMPSPR